jgi:Glycosyltransferase sugar-binding region containing DXD motif
MRERHQSAGLRRFIRPILALIRNLLLAALLYTVIFCIILLARNPGRVKGKLGIPAVLDKSGPADILRTTKSGVQVKFAASSSAVTINPHANVFNRPMSLVVAKDDYLGPRPHVDIEADLKLLVEECRGTYAGMERVRNVYECLKFLDTGKNRYFRLPPMDHRGSRQDPRRAEYANSDGRDNTQETYVDPENALPSSKESIGTCAGPVIPYHTFWSGPATWRLEIFIKGYLYTQNLPCSKLHIWLDEDRHPTAVSEMLNKDPLFARFLPFVERGDIVVMSWQFPSRIPLPKHEDNTDGIGYYKNPSKPNLKGETAVADGVIEDAQGQQWLVISPKQMTFLPQSVSDAVRFVALHMHGGVFFEVDVFMLRDMRPLLLPKDHSFAERWAAYPHPGDFNTAVMSLTANSSLSSYLIRGGVRMGLNFHPRVIGRMAWKDGRDQELLMLETAVFDPIWTEASWEREGRCTVPCLKDYTAAFKGKANVMKEEWESYSGPELEHIDINNPPTMPTLTKDTHHQTRTKLQEKDFEILPQRMSRQQKRLQKRDNINAPPSPESTNSFTATSAEEAELRGAGAIDEYRLEEDKFPPNNRTMEHFFKGAWSYHVHNQVIDSLGANMSLSEFH